MLYFENTASILGWRLPFYSNRRWNERTKQVFCSGIADMWHLTQKTEPQLQLWRQILTINLQPKISIAIIQIKFSKIRFIFQYENAFSFIFLQLCEMVFFSFWRKDRMHFQFSCANSAKNIFLWLSLYYSRIIKLLWRNGKRIWVLCSVTRILVRCVFTIDLVRTRIRTEIGFAKWFYVYMVLKSHRCVSRQNHKIFPQKIQ